MFFLFLDSVYIYSLLVLCFIMVFIVFVTFYLDCLWSVTIFTGYVLVGWSAIKVSRRGRIGFLWPQIWLVEELTLSVLTLSLIMTCQILLIPICIGYSLQYFNFLLSYFGDFYFFVIGSYFGHHGRKRQHFPIYCFSKCYTWFTHFWTYFLFVTGYNT